MKFLAALTVILVALLHFGFLALEMFYWDHPVGQEVFSMTPEQSAETAALAANQGLYNGFLAAGLLGVPLGTALLEHVRTQPLKLGVGVLLIVYSAWMGLVRRPPIATGGGRAADAAAGFVGGRQRQRRSGVCVRRVRFWPWPSSSWNFRHAAIVGSGSG